MCVSKFQSVLLTATLLVLSEPALPETDLTAPAAGQFRQVSTALRSIIESALARSGARGVSAAVVLPNEVIIAEAAGYADSETGEPMTTDTLFLGASTGKTYVAATLMTLVEEQRLNLDDKISTWLGDEPWFERLPNHDDITLRMLLNHSSGIPDHIYQKSFQWSRAWQIRRNRDAYYQPVELIEFILDKPPRAPAGDSYGYTDTAYILVGLIIEKVAGNAYYNELQNRILTPLALDSVVPSNSREIPGLAAGYVAGNFINYVAGVVGKNLENGLLNRNPASEWTGGGLATTPSALAKFYAALFRGEILRQDSIDEMISSTVPLPNPYNQAYGLGVFVIENEEFGVYLHHSGWIPGYMTNVIYYRDYDFAVALQMNQDYNYDIFEPVKDIARAVISTFELEEHR